MRNRVIWAVLAVFLLSTLAAAVALPTCPSNNVCLFSGVKLEQIKPGPSGATFSTSGFACPVSAPVTGTFGGTYKNLNNEDRVRQGVEIRGPEGTDVRAAASGTVVESQTDLLRYGRYVTIRHASNPNVETTYGFLQPGSNIKAPGDKVNKGDVIGKSGKSEADAFPSLYFELRRAGLPQRDVESICKTTEAPKAQVVAVAGAVDCSKFVKNAVPEPWSVIPGGLFHASRDGGAREHGGFDFGGKDRGTPVFSVWPGKVRYYKYAGGYGNEVSIRTECTDGSSRIVTYDHLEGYNKAVLDKGTVQAGETIGYVGSSGGNYAVHLHINVFGPPLRIAKNLDDGNRVNPENLLVGGLSGRVVG